MADRNTMKRFLKILAGIFFVLLVAVALYSAYVYNMLTEMRPDRGDAYQARMHYLPNSVPATQFAMEGMEDWFKNRLHNPLIDKGPYIVAYPLTDGEAKKAVVVLPGGGYLFRSEKPEGIEIANWLNDNGIAAFVLNYRLQQHPVPVSDVQAGFRYIRSKASEFNIRPDQLGVMGFSAGGHLAATSSTLFTADSRPDFTILSYPVIYMDGPFAHGSSTRSLLGNAPSADLITAVSPHLQVTEQTPPAFIWAPVTDTVVPWENSRDYAKALEAAGIPYELKLFEEGAHGSGLAQHEKFASAWPQQMLEWLATF